MLKYLEGLLLLLEKVTWGRAILWGFTVLVAIALFNLYETRQSSIPALFANTVVLGVFGAAIIIGGISWGGMFLMRRVDEKADELSRYMKDRIEQLEAGLNDYRMAEERCVADLASVRIRLTKAERILRQNGLELDETK